MNACALLLAMGAPHSRFIYRLPARLHAAALNLRTILSDWSRISGENDQNPTALQFGSIE